jgi:hypothetical protein
MLREIAMQKITLTAAIAAVLLFAIVAGTAASRVDAQSGGLSPSKYVSGHHAILSPVW